MTAKANQSETKRDNFNDKEMLKSHEPAARRGGGDTTSAAGNEFEGGSRGIHSGVNVEQNEKVSGKP